jgi:phospholipid/cholesterol/gamma-HCH transport system ATP-binding protein
VSSATIGGSYGLSQRDEELVKLCATNLLEVVPDMAVAMARHLHTQLPELGALDDEEAVESTRASCEANMREMCIMLRAGIPATAHETPTDALEYARFMSSRGVGYTAILRAYQSGVSMFQPVAGTEFARRAPDEESLRRTTEVVVNLVWGYIYRVTERLASEYGLTRTEEFPGPEDAVWFNPESIKAAEEFMSGRVEKAPEGALTKARERAQRTLDSFCARLEAAARNERLARRLGQADTTVRIELADEPDLGTTLLLHPDRVGIDNGDSPAEVEMCLSSVDLERIYTEDFNLSMAIARGRVLVSGPVRKFLRVMPIVRTLPEPEEAGRAGADGAGYDGHGGDITAQLQQSTEEESKFSPAQRTMLDQAAEYELHQGAMQFEEEAPGHFWSIECVDVYKTFGKNRVLNGLNVGIPEGMITVVLGPSGTGKSVLISHLIGLMFPDQGKVIVHGESVADLRMSQLLELRRKFGILFQDGALFGSMNVYDNVAFPLRQHTDYPEERVAEIVNHRLAEVGLGGAGDRMPGELSGGMRKRAGFARALVLEPEIVMFDEPDSGLDPVRTALLCELIQQMHAEHGGTYIVITHDIASARRIADYLVVLWKGRIVQSGDRDDMFTSPNPFVRQFIAGKPRGPLGME